MHNVENVRLAQTCCPNCHLMTRSDYKKCLHCGKRLGALEPGTHTSSNENAIDTRNGTSRANRVA
jgi:hypothetical protein